MNGDRQAAGNGLRLARTGPQHGVGVGKTRVDFFQRLLYASYKAAPAVKEPPMPNRTHVSITLVAGFGVALITATAAHAQTPPSYGWDFATIGAPGNEAFDPMSGFDSSDTRRVHMPFGAVGYEYRISRTELRTSQWIDFLNTFPTLDPVGPFIWGAARDAQSARWRPAAAYPNAGEFPLLGISWRTAARYCNWLHNGQSSDPSSLLTGAYDVSTFGRDASQPGVFTDQLTRSPGARYWIPSYDEWAKAVYFDPNRHGEAQPGYWRYPQSSDAQPVYGPPGLGTANVAAGGNTTFGRWDLAVGAYVGFTSPWGLLDAAGAGPEWTEHPIGFSDEPPFFRAIAGSSALDEPFNTARFSDQIGFVQGRAPDFPLGSFRIASRIPAPGTAACLPMIAWFLKRRTR